MIIFRQYPQVICVSLWQSFFMSITVGSPEVNPRRWLFRSTWFGRREREIKVVWMIRPHVSIVCIRYRRKIWSCPVVRLWIMRIKDKRHKRTLLECKCDSLRWYLHMLHRAQKDVELLKSRFYRISLIVHLFLHFNLFN